MATRCPRRGVNRGSEETFMQYEFLFQPCRYDGTKVEAQNPFTGKPWLVPTK